VKTWNGIILISSLRRSPSPYEEMERDHPDFQAEIASVPIHPVQVTEQAEEGMVLLQQQQWSCLADWH